ncbi:protease inhibitor I42 family protein [Streptomyces sp. NBC_00704]|uniref:protease inhibitor I42 family protein n=1 Tax=Streptomyces sp. NBC_00704 TaxID=2975809 RepID=UPI002E34BF62|nr:protease inhibitor I42 family protein [Streptomyces sp. NBC_00704]
MIEETGEPMAAGPGRIAGAALCAVMLLAGCASGSGADAPTSHPTQDTTIAAEVGERFTLSVPENASTREHWSVVAPRPDASVVRTAGRRYESADDGKSVGGGGTLVLTFEATGAGSTGITLLHCTFPTAGAAACGGGASPSATPPPEPERRTYRVTVR